MDKEAFARGFLDEFKKIAQGQPMPMDPQMMYNPYMMYGMDPSMYEEAPQPQKPSIARQLAAPLGLLGAGVAGGALTQLALPKLSKRFSLGKLPLVGGLLG